MNEKKDIYLEIQTVCGEILSLIDSRNSPELPSLGMINSMPLCELRDKLHLQWHSGVDSLIQEKEEQFSLLINSWQTYYANETKLIKSKPKKKSM